MTALEIIAIALSGMIVIGSIIAAVVRKKHGKTCCDCDNCSMCGRCKQKENQ